MVNQVTVEIETAPGVWTDITPDLFQRDKITITRGRSDEQSQAGPQRMAFTLDNRDGRYSPRNPLSPLFGKVGRNTPVRCMIDNGAFFRFYGEISGLPPNWDPSHSDNRIPVEAYGSLRRLGQGEPPASTALRDFILNQPAPSLATLSAYYPLSGGEETIYSQNLAPSKSGSWRGVPAPGPGPIFTYGREMAPWIGTGMELNATGTTSYMSGRSTLDGDCVAFEFVWDSPALGVLQPQITDRNGRTWLVTMNTPLDAATITVVSTDDEGVSTVFPATGAIPELQDQSLHHFRLLIATNGADTDYTLYIDGTSVDSGTLAGAIVRGCRETRFHYTRYMPQTIMNMAHLTIWVGDLADIPDVADVAAAARGFAGETAVDRITRICADGGIPLVTVGVPAASMPMGPQIAETRLGQIRDCEATDLGILAEDRVSRGLLYVSRSSMYNQSPQFRLDYSARQVFPPLDPIDDDQATRNDVTATRRGGGSVRYSVDTGPLSTQDPPVGVGYYSTEVTVNVETDDQLDAIAGWVAGIGTLDQARWPSVTVNLDAPGVSSGLADAIKDADVGDRFLIRNMGQAFINDDVSLLIVGYTETIDPFVHMITFNCMPAEPYEVFVVESTGSRIDNGDTSLTNASMTTTATSMSVLSADASTLWTTSAGDLPISIMVGGEEMTVTAISGTTPGVAQTFTVTRSVNQVVKTHSSGETVRLKRRAVVAL